MLLAILGKNTLNRCMGIDSCCNMIMVPIRQQLTCWLAAVSLHIRFAYSSTTVLLEVQNTLREPPAATVSMRKTVPVSITTAFVLVRGADGSTTYAEESAMLPITELLRGSTQLVQRSNSMFVCADGWAGGGVQPRSEVPAYNHNHIIP